MWCRWMLAGACLGFPVAALAQNDAPTIPQLVNLAITRNRDVLATRERIREAQGLLRQAGVRPVPTLEVEGGTGRPLGTVGEEEYNAGYFYPIETGGKRAKRMAVSEQSVALAEAELKERIRQLRFDVESRAIDALAEQEKVATLERLSRVNQEAYRLTEARVREGDVAPLEAQLLLVEQNRAEAQRVVTLGRAQAAMLEVRRVVGLRPEDPLPAGGTLASAPRDLSLEALTAIALKTRPDLQVNRLLETQGRAEVTLAEAQAKPDITLNARYTHRSAQFENQYGLSPTGAPVPLRDVDNVVSFGVSIPLQTRKRNAGNIEAASARATAARLRREYLEQNIPLEVEAAYRKWIAARSAFTVLDRGVVGQSEKNLAIVRQAYQLGQLRLLDVLNEQRRLVDTELAYIDAKADWARAEAELKRATGGELP